MVYKFFRRLIKSNHLQATLDQKKFKALPFNYGWNNLVKSYDLRMYYIQNGTNEERTLQYVQDLERIHNELNYLSMRGGKAKKQKN